MTYPSLLIFAKEVLSGHSGWQRQWRAATSKTVYEVIVAAPRPAVIELQDRAGRCRLWLTGTYEALSMGAAR